MFKLDADGRPAGDGDCVNRFRRLGDVLHVGPCRAIVVAALFSTGIVYGVPISFGTSDKGDWKTIDKATVHVDWCAADWTDPEMKFLLTLKHESPR